MRKDVRLGLGVGGILFGVVLVYVLFFAGGGNGADELAGDLDAGASESTRNDGSGGSSADSSKPAESGTPLVNMGSITGIGGGTPTGTTSLAGNTGAHGNNITPPIGAGGPTTRPIGSVAGNNFGTPPTANSAAWNWRELVNKGAKNGELLSHTETPTYGGGGRSSVVDQPLNIQIEPPRGSYADAGPSTRPSGPRVHVVRSGESFWTIAKNEYGNPSYYSHLARANPKVDPAKLKAGMRITIPAKEDVVPRTILTSTVEPQSLDETRQYRVRKGDSLSVIASRLYGRIDMADRIYEVNRDVIGPNPSALKLNAVLTLPESPTRTLAAGTN